MSESVLARLKQRKVVQWSLAYLAGAWVVMQLVDVIGGRWGWTSLAERSIDVILLVGLGVTLVLAWFHGEKGHQKVTPIELLMLAALFLIAGTGLVLVRGDAGPPSIETIVADDFDPKSIAVLPFENLSDDAEQEYFSLGLSEELLNLLAQIEGLSVASKTSAFALADAGLPIDSIAQRLRVAHVVEGNVRRSGERLRITAQLIEASSDTHLWSETYDETVSDWFDIEDRISTAIATELQLKLLGEGAVAARSTVDPEAHDLYLRGREKLNSGLEVDLREALDYFRRALELDPAYALAWSGVADAYVFLADAYISPLEAVTAAREAALNALEIAEIPEARAALGYTRLPLEWDWEGGLRDIDQALSQNPNHPMAYVYRAMMLWGLDRWDEMIETSEQAIVLDPLSPFGRLSLQWVMVARRQWEETLALEAEVLELDPSFFYLESYGAMALRALGRAEEALAVYERASRYQGDQGFPGLAVTYLDLGREAEAREILARLESEAEERYVAPFVIAWIYAALGEEEAMFAHLEEGYAVADAWIVFSPIFPEFDPYRDDPRMRDLVDRVNVAY